MAISKITKEVSNGEDFDSRMRTRSGGFAGRVDQFIIHEAQEEEDQDDSQGEDNPAAHLEETKVQENFFYVDGNEEDETPDLENPYLAQNEQSSDDDFYDVKFEEMKEEQ